MSALVAGDIQQAQLVADGAMVALRQFKTDLIQGVSPLVVVARMAREIRELENLQRRGERKPGTLVVTKV